MPLPVCRSFIINCRFFPIKTKMRREFILVLLGIICISTLSSLLSGYVQTETNKVLLDTVVGSVVAGNFSYWQLAHTGNLLVELTSLSGDADLYVSDSLRPSYEVERNNFSSETCGPDLVNIPVDFPRPIGIGVFGYWNHEVSEYSIQVFLHTSTSQNHETIPEADVMDRRMKKKDKASHQRIEDSRPAKPRFTKLLSIIDMIFETFLV